MEKEYNYSGFSLEDSKGNDMRLFLRLVLDYLASRISYSTFAVKCAIRIITNADEKAFIPTLIFDAIKMQREIKDQKTKDLLLKMIIIVLDADKTADKELEIIKDLENKYETIELREAGIIH